MSKDKFQTIRDFKFPVDNQGNLQCPFTDCEQPVFLTFTGSFTMSPDDLFQKAPGKNDVHSDFWEIKCLSNHTILVTEDTADHDYEFTGGDLLRLRDLYAQLGYKNA